MEIKKINTSTLVIVMAVIGLSALALLFSSAVAPKLFVGLVLLYVMPFYLIMGKFNLEPLEKLMLSLFVSLGVIPMAAYYLSKVAGSLRASLVIILVVLYGLTLFLNKSHLNKEKLKGWLALSHSAPLSTSSSEKAEIDHSASNDPK